MGGKACKGRREGQRPGLVLQKFQKGQSPFSSGIPNTYLQNSQESGPGIVWDFRAGRPTRMAPRSRSSQGHFAGGGGSGPAPRQVAPAVPAGGQELGDHWLASWLRRGGERRRRGLFAPTGCRWSCPAPARGKAPGKRSSSPWPARAGNSTPRMQFVSTRPQPQQLGIQGLGLDSGSWSWAQALPPDEVCHQEPALRGEMAEGMPPMQVGAAPAQRHGRAAWPWGRGAGLRGWGCGRGAAGAGGGGRGGRVEEKRRGRNPRPGAGRGAGGLARQAGRSGPEQAWPARARSGAAGPEAACWPGPVPAPRGGPAGKAAGTQRSRDRGPHPTPPRPGLPFALGVGALGRPRLSPGHRPCAPRSAPAGSHPSHLDRKVCTSAVLPSLAKCNE